MKAKRDYTDNVSVQVMLFQDRLEVWNPGILPYGLTIPQLEEPRNATDEYKYAQEWVNFSNIVGDAKD